MSRRWMAILAGVLCAGVLLALHLYSDRQEVSRQERERLVSLAAALDVNISDQMRASSRMLDQVVQAAPALLQEPDGVRRLSERLGMLCESITGIRTLLVFNAQSVVVASNRKELIGKSGLGNDRNRVLRAARDTQTMHVSAPFTTPMGTYTIGLGKVMLNRRQEFDGYVLAILSPDYYGVLMRSLLYAPEMRYSIAHEDGQLIYSTQSVPDIRGVDLSKDPHSMFNRHKGSGQSASFFIDSANATGELRFMALHTVRPAQALSDKALVVAVSRDASAVLADWEHASVRATAAFTAAVLLLCGGYVIYARRERSYQALLVQQSSERRIAEVTAKNARFVRTITDAMPEGVAYFDRQLRCRFANKAYQDWYGLSESAVLGARLDQLLGDVLFEKNRAHIEGVLAGEEQEFERHLTRRDGSVGHVLARYLPDRDDSGAVLGFHLVVIDIKAMRMAEAGRKITETVFDRTAEGIMVTDAARRIVSVNPAFTAITGYPAQAAMGQPMDFCVSDHYPPEFHAEIERQMADSGTWQGEVWTRRSDGQALLMWQTITRVRHAAAESEQYVAVFHDMTDAWRLNEHNRHLAFHDALTDLPNRALLMERLERQIAVAQRAPRSLALLFLDLDGFKAVNDALGHAAGDELLKIVASRLLGLVRQVDTVARLGGDEFVVLLESPASEDEVLQIARRIAAAIAQPVPVSASQIRISTAIGIAFHPRHGATAQALLASADAAMYQAKRRGGNAIMTQADAP